MPDWKNRTALDPEIKPNGGPRTEFDEASRVFVTGATGFLGGFVTAQILRRTAARVMCLVRAGTPENCLSRIREKMQAYGLWETQFKERIAPVAGDLSKPLLGMSPGAFDGVAESADVIFHCGAFVSYVHPYAALHATNVAGTEEVLRLACRSRDKTVHYVSSTSVFLATADAAVSGLREIRECEEPMAPGPSHSGYTQTKWAAEQLAFGARDRGMPVAIYRPSTIVGNSRTGMATSGGTSLIRAWIAIGALPRDLRDLNLAPVDYVAASIVHLALRRDSVGKAFHLVNPVKTPFSAVAEMLRAHGHSLPQIPNEEWRQRVTQTVAKSSDMNLVTLCMAAAQMERHQKPRTAEIRLDATNTIAGLAGSSITCPPIDRPLLDAFYAHMQKDGLLPVPAAAAG